ncbi:MAG: chemotaxis response regulator protein-glutamate methylesterase [Desulfobulbus sp.]|jgi:two-component system chemotaxis response regulator CheB|uniref:protein-glutamate methylesterase/protein-glutamine glutaminase n=1 Tax=Desulfobulbus sp. TaxID=895 RepID=UPI00284C7002|nr:chemotaxis response regulator protein-glutamate methylesterase [Desulfobulbus sp.]MDR2549342.1 chemotaxis response regulator protein-glutamate methylesterase [Desulfobulbus sp.]
MFSKKIKVLVVDDTIVYRKAVSDILAEMPGVEVVGVAHNGKIAVAKIQNLKPDLLTLDIEMPEMNGIEVLQYLQQHAPQVSAIMVSTLTSEGGDMTMRALELGAYDFILKPNTTNINDSKQHLRTLLTPLIKAFQTGRTTIGSMQGGSRAAMPRKPMTGGLLRPQTDSAAAARTKVGTPAAPLVRRQGKSEIVAIGISTGGPNALARMMPMLPGDLGVPIVIVQHMPAVFTKSLANSLDTKCALTVKEAQDSEILQANVAYIAPGGKQMKLVASADGTNRQIKITNDPPENSCRPSADYLFRSVADYYVGRTTAVIMTGMGSDGTKGLQVLKQKGALVIGQDEATCVVYGMPKIPAELGLTDVVAPLDRIAAEIMKSVK